MIPTLRPPEPRTAPDQDLIVIGSGVAGFTAAIEAARLGLKVLLVTKDSLRDSATENAQGGIAVALNEGEDDVELHFRDTMAAGDGLCDAHAVRALVEGGPARVSDLMRRGARFDREEGRLAFAREGAHSARRVVHAGGDSTGHEIVRALLDAVAATPGIEIRSGDLALDLIVEGGRCAGVRLLGAAGDIRAARGAVVIATGGAGQVYRETSNPAQATGDGLAMAWLAGALVRDLEFVQFHPTCLAIPGAPRFLISEAVRGEGARLLGRDGRRFMIESEPVRAELAPRDVVARAIAREMRASGSTSVSLDISHLDAPTMARRFPRIHRTCLEYGIDMTKEPIPVGPAAHYMMGGIATDLAGRTTLPGLYAAGEAACTGVHGANRLASNSLLEGLVFGARAGEAAARDRIASGTAWPREIPGMTETVPGSLAPGAASLAGADPESIDAARSAIEAVRGITWEEAGLLREAEGLGRAFRGLRSIPRRRERGALTREGVEARNMLLVASLIAAFAAGRTESRGAHHRLDHPARDDARWGRSLLLGADGSSFELVPAPEGATSWGRRSPSG
ncbi:MAG TPA: L-aspartate oxidase, partial [Verrucomicrobiae bacterium]|nr:L-aspartate oxidase [Verrucomicrobiae bacterium]